LTETKPLTAEQVEEFRKWRRFRCIKCGRILKRGFRSVAHIDKMRETDLQYSCRDCKTNYLLEVYDTPKSEVLDRLAEMEGEKP